MKKIIIISSSAFSLILGIALSTYAQQDEKNEKKDQHKQQQEEKKQDKHDQQHAQQPQNQNRQQREVQQEQKQDQSRQHQQTRQQPKQDQGHQQEQRIQQMQDQDRQQKQAQQQQQRQDQSRQQQRVEQRQDQDRQQQQARQVRPEHNQDHQLVWQSTWQDHRARNWQSDHRSWQQRGGYNGYRIPQDRYRGFFGPQHWFRISGLPFAVDGGYPRFQYEGYWITLRDPWPENWSNDWYDNDDVYVDYGNDGYYMYNRRYPDVAIAISISM
jgi:hypothetical protein